jgi:hypothetical protein
MENQIATNKNLEELQKNLKLLTIITPILALAIVAIGYLIYFNDKTSWSLWCIPLFLTGSVLSGSYSVQKIKKANLSEMNGEEIQKNSTIITSLLAVHIISILLIGLMIAYLIIRPFGK